MTLKQKIILMHLDGVSNRSIAVKLHISKDTVNKYVKEYEKKKQGERPLMNYSKKTLIDFDKVVDIYNNEGRESTEKHLLDEYNTNLNMFFRRIKQETNYSYKRKKQFVLNNTGFLSIDDLCADKRTAKTSELLPPPAVSYFEQLLFELMKDKLE